MGVAVAHRVRVGLPLPEPDALGQREAVREGLVEGEVEGEREGECVGEGDKEGV